MTYQRVIKRNHLDDGDYGKPGKYKHITVNTDPTFSDEFITRLRCVELLKQEAAWTALAGDLRRLEDDSVDEASICDYIALRTGLDTDTVAIVLKEFMSY